MPHDSTQVPSACRIKPAWLAAAAGTDAGVLQLAVDYVAANAHRPIALDDVAAACHRGPRALQLIFQRAADITPWAYVRSVRLARAHQDLVRGTAPRDAVLTISLKWGYTNRSRFSAEYRAAYGEAPGVTLRRPWPVTSATTQLEKSA